MVREPMPEDVEVLIGAIPDAAGAEPLTE